MAKINETVFTGLKGIDKSWQEPWQPSTTCEKCGNEVPLTFVFYEEPGSKTVLADMKPDEFTDWWFHDAVAFACYICPKCWHSTVMWNEA